MAQAIRARHPDLHFSLPRQTSRASEPPTRAMAEQVTMAMQEAEQAVMAPKKAMKAMKRTKEKTASGLRKDDLVRNNAGKLVSRKKSALGKKLDRVRAWREAFMKARAVMGTRGFVAVNGHTAQGKAL